MRGVRQPRGGVGGPRSGLGRPQQTKRQGRCNSLRGPFLGFGLRSRILGDRLTGPRCDADFESWEQAQQDLLPEESERGCAA